MNRIRTFSDFKARAAYRVVYNAEAKGLSRTSADRAAARLMKDPKIHAAIRAALDRGAAVLAASYDPGGLPGLLGGSIALAEGAPA